MKIGVGIVFPNSFLRFATHQVHSPNWWVPTDGAILKSCETFWPLIPEVLRLIIAFLGCALYPTLIVKMILVFVQEIILFIWMSLQTIFNVPFVAPVPSIPKPLPSSVNKFSFSVSPIMYPSNKTGL